jgi:hypothetical protein
MMRRSPMPGSDPETIRDWRAHSQPLRRLTGLTVVRDIGSGGRNHTGPRDTIPAPVRRLVRLRDLNLCVHCGQRADHQHHRLLKGMGGSTGPHANCPCVLVSLCHLCHSWVHLDASRLEAMAEGLIIPRATPLPRLLPVLVHGFEDGAGQKAWPSCDGRWLGGGPDGVGAA